MKAAQINSYGKPDVIEVNPNAPTPTVQPDQVLIEVHVASINAIDWKLSEGLAQGMGKPPFPITLGGDFSGVVREVAQGVSAFKVGDEVYGNAFILGGGSGSMAEYAVANTKNTALKPKSTSWEEAAALPLVGASTVQALEEHIKLQAGQKILIQGGAGGIGSTAIQLAKSLGAYVATTVATRDTDFVKKLGADEVIDYKTQKFEEIVKDFDAVFDTVGGETAEKSLSVLKNGGVIVSMLGQPNPELAKEKNITSVGQFTKTTTEHLQRLASLVDAGRIKIQIDKEYPLEQVRDAFDYQENIHPRGKVVISIKK